MDIITEHTTGETGEKRLHCRTCGQDFVWTVGEQRFYTQHNLSHEPVRCTSCRAKLRANEPLSAGVTRARVAYPVRCADCGRATTVPFVPTGVRPVYCADCHSRQRPGTPLGY
jgi:CxxC-x17-CxxC domain-containing protein